MKFLSALVTQGSGVMGNLVVEKNGVIRTRNIPANPSTTFQQAVRATLASFAALWSSALDDTKRLAWKTYAATIVRTDALGKPKKLSGIDAYVGSNAALAAADLDPVDVPPSTTGGLSLPALSSIVIDDSSNNAIATFADVIGIDTVIVLSLSPGSISQGRSVYSGPFLRQGNQRGTAATSVTFAGVTTPAAGEKWGYRLSAVNDEGAVSLALSGLTTVVA